LSDIHKKQISFFARQADISKIKTQYTFIVYLMTVSGAQTMQY